MQAYSPSVDDIPQQQTYSPSLSDIPQDPTIGQGALDIARNYVNGASAGFGNTYINAANMLPGVNIPNLQRPQGFAGAAGNVVGNIGGFMAGGEALDTARAAAEALPYLGQAAQYLGQSGFVPSLLRQTMGTSAYGAVNDPNDRFAGALSGIGAGVAGSILPPVGGYLANKIGNVVGKFQPEAQASNLLDSISGSTFGQNGSLENTAKSLASDIRTSAANKEAISNQQYQPVWDAVGSNKIYRVNQAPEYFNLPDKTFDSYNNDLMDMHDEFENNPTFQNAHNLQSQLGSQIRYFQKRSDSGNLDLAGLNQLSDLNKAQDAVQADMSTFLSRQKPQIGQQYNNAQANYLKTVVPYYSTPSLAKISSGAEKAPSPTDLTSEFANPNNNISTVMGDLPSGTGDKLTYLNLGRVGATKSPENLVNAMKMLDQQGLSSYMSPGLQQAKQNLQSSLNNREMLQRATGMLAGGVLGHHIGEGAEGVSALAGTYLGPAMGRLASPFIPGASRSVGAPSFYPLIRNAVTSNYLGANQ